MRKTKIICTLGPASDSDEIVRRLIDNGMNCARFNFSHGAHADQKERMDRVKRISAEAGCQVALLLDTKGPEIRLRDFRDGAVILSEGQTFTLDGREDEPGDGSRVAISYPELFSQIETGTSVLIDDGKVAMTVTGIDRENGSIMCRVSEGGRISNRKGLNVPNLDIDMPFMSDADKQDILFGIAQKVDYIAASFVRTPDDVRELRRFLADNGGSRIKIISKIENRQGVRNIDQILALTDGIMVARGDLGVEIPFKNIPAIQKSIIDKCNTMGKLVVTATQMLESMTHSMRPTRAEVSDVANAIFDGTAAIMLSGETAAGDFPAETVHTMAEIAEASEKSLSYRRNSALDHLKLEHSIKNAVCASAYSAAEFLRAAAIVVVTRSGKTAKHISDFRPRCPIIAITMDETGRRQLSLEYGVFPMVAEYQNTADQLFEYAHKKALESGIVRTGDTIIVITASDAQLGFGNDVIRIAVI